MLDKVTCRRKNATMGIDGAARQDTTYNAVVGFDASTSTNMVA